VELALKRNQHYLSPFHYVLFGIIDPIATFFSGRNLDRQSKLQFVKIMLGDDSNPHRPEEIFSDKPSKLKKALQITQWQLEGALQPMESTNNRAFRAFSRYKNSRKRLEDYGMIVYGIANLVLTPIVLSIAIAQFVIGTAVDVLSLLVLGVSELNKALIGRNDVKERPFWQESLYTLENILIRLGYSASWIVHAASLFVRGFAQIIFSEIVMALMVVREIRTALRGAPKIEENASVQVLVNKGSSIHKPTDQQPKNINYSEILTTLHSKFAKGIYNGQPTTIDAKKESDLYIAAIGETGFQPLDQESARQYVNLFKPIKTPAPATTSLMSDAEAEPLLSL
jgi:hypothetical protein